VFRSLASFFVSRKAGSTRGGPDPEGVGAWWRPRKSHSARPVHLIIMMIKWFRASRLSIKKSLSLEASILLRPRAPRRIECFDSGRDRSTSETRNPEPGTRTGKAQIDLIFTQLFALEQFLSCFGGKNENWPNWSNVKFLLKLQHLCWMVLEDHGSDA